MGTRSFAIEKKTKFVFLHLESLFTLEALI